MQEKVVRCEFYRRADSTHYSCRGERVSVVGRVERGLVRWCATAQAVSRYGQSLGERRSCFARRADAEAFLEGAARGLASRSFGFGQLPRPVRRADYRLRDEDNALVRVNLEKLLARHAADEPSCAITDRRSPNVINHRRFDASRQYLLDTLSPDRQRWQRLHGSLFLFTDDGRLVASDGRHRLVAARELGHRHVYVEVPSHQVALFRQLRGLRAGRMWR